VFDRYSESARRALFFARYQVGQLGGTSIDLEHLLLGLMREPTGPVSRILAPLPLEKIRSEIESQSIFREKMPKSVEIPFSTDAKYGLRLTDVRLQIVQLLNNQRSSSASTGAQASERIDQIKRPGPAYR
jgi:ATP-dependent Clp protease ATP-binding subunit ClpA